MSIVPWYKRSEVNRKRKNELTRLWCEKFPQKRKESQRKSNAKRRKDLKLQILRHYSGALVPFCACCGEDIYDFLTLDHINNDGNESRKKHRRAGTGYYWILVRDKFPIGYQVLCFNCNCGKHINHGICPHKDIVKFQ